MLALQEHTLLENISIQRKYRIRIQSMLDTSLAFICSCNSVLFIRVSEICVLIFHLAQKFFARFQQSTLYACSYMLALQCIRWILSIPTALFDIYYGVVTEFVIALLFTQTNEKEIGNHDYDCNQISRNKGDWIGSKTNRWIRIIE